MNKALQMKKQATCKPLEVKSCLENLTVSCHVCMLCKTINKNSIE